MEITNTGSCDGAEVVQLYVQDPACSVERPVKELKGFQKVFLKAGEKKTVRFSLGTDALSFFDASNHAWVAEPGAFNLLVGASSEDIRATASFTLK